MIKSALENRTKLLIGLALQCLIPLLTACQNRNAAAEMTDREAEIARKIEQDLVLPEGAYVKKSYSQFFAWEPPHLVVSQFIIQDQGIEWQSRIKSSCAQDNIKEFPCTHPTAGVIKPGEKLWVESKYHMPFMLDGGCGMITIIYDASKSKIINARCNGRN